MLSILTLLLLAWTAAAWRQSAEDEDVAILQIAGGGVKQLNSTTDPTFTSPLRFQSGHHDHLVSESLGPEEATNRWRVHGRAQHVKHATEHFRVMFGHPRHRERGASQPFWAKVASVCGASVALLGINLMDVVWVLPYLVDKVHGTFNVLYYMFVGQLFVCLSILFVIIRGPTDGSAEHEHTVKILDTITTVLLVVYAAYCFYEEVLSGQQEKLETSATNTLEEEGHDKAPASGSNSKFMVLAVLGSFDQLAVYIPLLTTQVLTSLELEIGMLASTLLSVVLCFMIGQSSWMCSILAGIPMWLIVSVLATASIFQVATS